VILPGEAALYRGTPVEFEGRLSAGEEGGGLFLARLPDPGWEEGGAPEEAGLRLRRRILRWERAKLDSLGEAGGLIQALLFGLRDDLDGALLFQFRRAGVMHILALSGMHLGFLAAFLSFLLRPLGQRVVRPGILLFFVFYLFLTGFSVSLFRAAVMSGLYYLAQVRTGRAEALKVWGTSFILCFLVNPSGLSGPGFQLTFAALGGILILGLPLSRDLRGVLPGFAASPVGVSLGAQGASLPFLIYHFGAFAPAGLVCGLLLSPLIGVFMALGLVFLLLPDPGVLAFRLGVRLPRGAAFLYDGFQNLLQGVYRLIQETAAFFSGFPEVAVSPDRRGGVIAIFALIWLIIILGEAYDAERGRTQLRLAAAAARTSCPPGPGDE
jgi:ComEC/Rec2-related protein